MIEIELLAKPNQKLSIFLDDILYDITLKEAAGIIAATIERDGVAVLSGSRVVPGYPIVPYQYLESGNFVFLTDEGDYPNYEQFGITQFLVYASAAELAVIRG